MDEHVGVGAGRGGREVKVIEAKKEVCAEGRGDGGEVGGAGILFVFYKDIV